MTWAEPDQVAFFAEGELARSLEAAYGDAATLLELHHRPGAGVSGLFQVGETYLVVTTEDVASIAPGVPLETPHGSLPTWVHPEDPKLPGLGRASVPIRVEETWGGGSVLRELETVRYRPLRRAVLRATFDDPPGVVYLKVLRAGAELLATRHRLLREAGVPAPELVGDVVDEVVAVRAVAGVPLAQAMHDAREEPPLPPQRVLDLIDAFPAALMELPARAAWSDRLAAHAEAAAAALPEEAEQIRRVRDLASVTLSAEPRGPRVPTHGDLYEANLFVSGGEITGVIDVDSAGPGHVVDDLACFAAHLAVLPSIDAGYAHVSRFVEVYLDAFGSHLAGRGASRAGLLARTAAVVLSLIAGARDEAVDDWREVARSRLELARDFAEAARAAS